MPITESRRGWVRWQAEGEGEPLLMVMGLSGSARAWHRLLPHVAEHHRAIVFDHRGTGDSDRLRGPQSMRDLVDDCLAVLDAAGARTAHVMGVSMGGMVAQHLALDHRERVRSLVLGSTTAVGRRGLPPWRLVGASVLRPVLGDRHTWPVLAPALYGQATREGREDRIAEDLAIRVGDATPASTAAGQLAAIARHDTRARLHELAGLATLVLHGDQDGLVPLSAGRALADGIPGARLVIIGGCGHMMTTDAETQTADEVLAHLRAAVPQPV